MKTKSKILVSAVLVIALCASLIAGTTFALFTSESGVSIAVTSGKVDVVATVDKQYNGVGYQVSSTLGEACVQPGFDANDNLVLSKIVPGDSVKVKIDVVNKSTVAVNYRASVSVTDVDGALSQVLVVTNEVSSEDAISYDSKWHTLAAAQSKDGDNMGSVYVTVTLPEEVKDHMDETCKVSFAVEAVQGNAPVSDIEQGVEMRVTYNPDFVENFPNAAVRIAYANEALAAKESYATLAEAQAALSKLFVGQGQGNYSEDRRLGLNGENISYENVGPLNVNWRELPYSQSRPIQKMEYIVHGTVEAGEIDKLTHTMEGGSGEFASIPEVSLKGFGSDATLVGVKGLSAFVAGGHKETLVEEGTFTISNIEFAETTGKTSINAYFPNIIGSNAEDVAPWKANLIIDGCTFHNMLYHYMHYANTPNPNVEVTVKNCNFLGADECTETYAYFVQGYATKILFENNTISNYNRGLNVEVEKLAARCEVIIRNNTIGANRVANKNVIQLTGGSVFVVEGNTITTDNGNAITFHENLVKETSLELQSITVKNNTINAKYFIYNEAGDISEKVTIDGNKGTIENVGKMNNGKAEVDSSYIMK